MNKAAVGILALGGLGALAFAAGSKASPSANDDTNPIPPDSTDGPSFDVTASDGDAYRVMFVKSFDTPQGKQSFWDLFQNGNRIVRYSQLEDDTSSRVFIVSPLSPTSTLLSHAMSDFGIAFEGGPVSDDIVLVDDVKTVPGQMVIMPGEYLATVAISFPKSLVVTADLLKAGIQEQGFRQVAVFTSAPKDWPISKDGDYFVQCVWDSNPKLFNVPPEVVDVRSRALA